MARAKPGLIEDGVSLLPLLKTGRWHVKRNDILLEAGPFDKPEQEYTGLRTPRYMFSVYGNGEQELYDLQRRPVRARQPGRVARVRGRCGRCSPARLQRLRYCAGASCRPWSERSRAARAGRPCRSGPPARPSAIASAARRPCVGTKPSVRATDGVAAPGDQHRAEPVDDGRAAAPVDVGQHRVACVAAPVGVERALVARGRLLGLRQRVEVARAAWKNARYGSWPGCGNRRRKRWTRIAVPPSTPGNGRARAAARSRARAPRRASGFGRSRGSHGVVSGMPTQMTSTGSASGRRATSAPRSSASACATDGGPANTPSASQLDRQARAGSAAVRARAAGRTCGRAPSRPAARAPRCRAGSPAARRQHRVVERERDAHAPRPRGRARARGRRRAASPATRPSRAASTRPPARSATGRSPRASAAGPAVADGLGGAHGHDEVGLDQAAVDAQRRRSRSCRRRPGRRPRRRGLHPAVEAPRELRRDERARSAWRRGRGASPAATSSVCRSDGMPHATSASIVASSAARRGSPSDARERQRGRLDDDGRPAAARSPPPRAPARPAGSGARRARRRRRRRSATRRGRAEEDGVFGRVEVLDPRPGEQRERVTRSGCA